MQTVKRHIKRRLLGIFTGMPEMFVHEFSVVTICPNREIISNAYGDAVLLQKTANRGPLPICQTIFQLDKNNLDRFGNLPVASDTVKFLM
jgi:hypothetical protein